MITRTLRLASPLMRGNDVKAAQGTLISKGYLPLKSADGVYGPVTANAAKQAKYRLGYATADLVGTYGVELDAYLRGKKQPSLLMRQRAKQRTKKPDSTLGERVADTMTRWAISGYKEAPAGSNFVPQLSAIATREKCPPSIARMRFAWCSFGVFLAALEHDATSGITGMRQNIWNALYTPTVQQMAREGRYGLKAVSARYSIVKGVGVLFDFDGDGVDHVGVALGKPGQVVIVNGEKWKPKRSQIVTVECNTSYEGDRAGSQANGGACAIRIRDVSLVETAFTIS